MDFSHCVITTDVMKRSHGQIHSKYKFSYDNDGSNIKLKKIIITLNRNHFETAQYVSSYPIYVSTYVLAWTLLHEKGGYNYNTDSNINYNYNKLNRQSQTLT